MGSEPAGKTFFPRRVPLVPAALILLMLGMALFGEKGLFRALQAHRHKEDLSAEAERLDQVKAELRQEIEKLRSDRRTIEDIARKELGMVKEDELVYQFPPTTEAPPPASEP